MRDLVLECSSARPIVLVMPSLVQINESFMEVLKVFFMAKTITVDFDRSFPKVRRRVVTGGKIRKVDVSGGKQPYLIALPTC